MEASCNTAKRKKRRTRKCLDEIRKKSRRNCDLESEVPLEKLKKAAKSLESIKLSSNRCCSITSKRLTLNPTIFSKAVRSETITRPLISCKPRVDATDAYNAAKATVISSSSRGSEDRPIVGDRLLEERDNSSSQFVENSKEIEEISFHDDSDSNRGNESPKSFIVFSPISQAIETEVIEESPRGEEVVASTSTSRPRANRGGSAGSRGSGGSDGSSARDTEGSHELYAQFMDEISHHLDRHAPNFVQPNVMRRTYKYLRNIYMEGCRRQPEQNILRTYQRRNDIEELMSDKENIRVGSPEIVENPMQYIRMGVQRRRRGRGLNESCPSSPLTASRPSPPSQSASPSPSPSPQPSPIPSYSPQLPCSSPTQLSIINDTPEYTFYPRKLNQ